MSNRWVLGLGEKPYLQNFSDDRNSLPLMIFQEFAGHTHFEIAEVLRRHSENTDKTRLRSRYRSWLFWRKFILPEHMLSPGCEEVAGNFENRRARTVWG